MMLISEAYREQNRALHEINPAYGTSGQKWATQTVALVAHHRCLSVLDYGCGKATLKTAVEAKLGFNFTKLSWRDYDPCIEGLDSSPKPADLVVCGDVMEHIEPEAIDDVLADIARLAKKAALLVIATRPALKHLPDGRNAHLIVKPSRWWLKRILHHFDLSAFEDRGEEFVAVVVPRMARLTRGVAPLS